MSYIVIFLFVCLQAEELIKVEMLMMLRHDLIQHPKGKVAKVTLSKVKADFDTSTYTSLEEGEREMVLNYS